MEILGKVIVGAIIGAIINAIGLFCLGLFIDYQHGNIRTFAPVGGIILGFFFGGIIGGVIGLIRTGINHSLYAALIVLVPCILFVFISNLINSESVINSGNSHEKSMEIIALTGLSIYLLTSSWAIAKITSLIKSKNEQNFDL